MKLVRKLLRLFPFIILFSIIILTCFFVKGTFAQYDTESGLGSFDNLFSQFYKNFITLWDTYGMQFFDIFGIGSRISKFLNDNSILSNDFVVDFSLSTLSYELFLSIMFLFFDVFNFMIGVASNWLQKGENLND